MIPTLRMLTIVLLLAGALSACGVRTTADQPAAPASGSVANTTGNAPQPSAVALQPAQETAVGNQNTGGGNSGGISSGSTGGNSGGISSGSPGGAPAVTSPPEAASSAGGAGQTVPGGPAESGNAAGAGGATQPQAPGGWASYKDDQFGFSIAYPNSLAVQGKLNAGETAQEGQMHHVAFMDKALAASDTAALQLPQFTVDVFTLPANTSQEQWLDGKGFNGTRTSVTINGRAGYQVSTQSMQAPNTFYFIATDKYVYQLTPLGPYGDEMLKSFALL